jgi:hypothetical protein
MRKRKPAKAFGLDQLSRVELPGIEPGPEIALSCEDTGFEYAKRREMTPNDLRIRRWC